MKNFLDLSARKLDTILIVFFKHLFRTDPNKTEKGLGRTHFELLRALAVAEADGDVVTPSEMAKRLLVTRAYTTALTDKLVSKGLISRRPDKNDRRVVNISLTEKGMDALREKSAESVATYKRRLGSLDAEDLRVLYESLENVERILSLIDMGDL